MPEIKHYLAFFVTISISCIFTHYWPGWDTAQFTIGFAGGNIAMALFMYALRRR